VVVPSPAVARALAAATLVEDVLFAKAACLVAIKVAARDVAALGVKPAATSVAARLSVHDAHMVEHLEKQASRLARVAALVAFPSPWRARAEDSAAAIEAVLFAKAPCLAEASAVATATAELLEMPAPARVFARLTLHAIQLVVH
jgi:hypothetical protein